MCSKKRTGRWQQMDFFLEVTCLPAPPATPPISSPPLSFSSLFSISSTEGTETPVYIEPDYVPLLFSADFSPFPACD